MPPPETPSRSPVGAVARARCACACVHATGGAACVLAGRVPPGAKTAGGVSCLALSRSFSGDDLGNDPSRAAFQYGYVRALEDVCDMSTPHNDVQYVLRFICCWAWACGLWPVACGMWPGLWLSSSLHSSAAQQQQTKTLTHSQAQYCTVLYCTRYYTVKYYTVLNCTVQ